MLRGRQRYRSHGGIPHGSTNNLGATLAFYLQNNFGLAVSRWLDQSSNANNANQGTEDNQPAIENGGLNFIVGEEDHMDFGSEIDVTAQHGFTIFLVCNLHTTSANMTILSLNSAAHFLEFKGGADAIRIKLGSTTTQVDPGDGSQNDFSSGSNMLVTLQRESGSDGNLNIWKNGVLLAQDSQAANNGDAEFVTIGSRNSDRFFNGIILDMAFVDSGATSITDQIIDRTNAYLLGKHGIN